MGSQGGVPEHHDSSITPPLVRTHAAGTLDMRPNRRSGKIPSDRPHFSVRRKALLPTRSGERQTDRQKEGERQTDRQKEGERQTDRQKEGEML